MSVTVSQSASLTINGVTPSAGTGFTLLANPSLVSVNITEQDFFANIMNSQNNLLVVS